MSDITLRVAAKALVVSQAGQVLILREATTYEEGTNIGRYGLPGGRIDIGEAFFDGLKREIAEETGLAVEPQRPLYIGEWRPTIKDTPHQIIALFMLCTATDTNTVLSEEHDQALWITPEDYHTYDLMPPDDKVIEAYINTR